MWTDEENKRKKFWAKVDYHGYSRDEALGILGVTALSDYRGTLGQALNEIIKANNDGGNGRAITTADPKGLYPSKELYQFGLAVRSFAPWANGKYPMTDQEIALVVRRSDALGVDPLNPHEVQIWKDRKGIQLQLSYTLIAQWANQGLGGHTKPRYRPLTREEKQLQGIPESHKATRVSFVMKNDIPLIAQMIDAGWDAKQAREDLEIVGVATASPDEWGSRYFAPNGRSKRWKLQKRAYVDAIRRRFGTPSRADIEQLRRARGEDGIDTEDWREASRELPDQEGVGRLARVKATQRQEPLGEEKIERAKGLLSPDGDLNDNGADTVVDGEFVDEFSVTNTSKKAASKTNNGSRPYDPLTLREKITSGIENKREKEFTFRNDGLKRYRGAMNANLEMCFAGDKHSNQKRHFVLEYLVGKTSSSDMDDAEVRTVHKWLGATKDEDTGEWHPDPTAVIEARAVARQAALDAGQQEMEL